MLKIILFFSIFAATANSSRILCYFPTLSKSHTLLTHPIVEELAKRGHHLTIITNSNLGFNHENIKEIFIETRGYYGEFAENLGTGKVGTTVKSWLTVIQQFGENNVETATSPAFQKVLKEESFDLIFFLYSHFNNFQLGIADHFKAPWVVFSPLGQLLDTQEMMGYIGTTSVIPARYSNILPDMNFLNRARNLVNLAAEWLVTRYVEYNEYKLYKQLWPHASRTFDEMKINGSVMFLNGHWSENNVIQPFLPNIIEIGGIQINETPKPLEANIQKFLDEAVDGVIYWTFGTNVELSKLEPRVQQIFFKILGNLKQKVLIRWELDDTSMLPANFKAQKWIKQDSVLAHKNVKLFITHGGHGGLMEALYHEVPILGFPLFADQGYNMIKITNDGWGIQRDIQKLTEEGLSSAINELLTTDKYIKRAQELSRIYRDRQAKPLDLAVYWIEYTLRHHGAPHLNYRGKTLNTIQYNQIDSFFFVLAVLGILVYLVKKGVGCACSKVLGCFTTKNGKTGKKVKKQ